jgi:hypothetical protein
MPTHRHVSGDTFGSYYPNVHCGRYRAAGALGQPGVGVKLRVKVDNESSLAWLEEALAHAFTHGRSELWAYLQAVMDDVLFEMELEARL